MEKESLNLHFPVGAAHLKELMEEAWPYLRKFSWESTWSGDCNAGYEYRFKVNNYGNFPNFIPRVELDDQVTGFWQNYRVTSEGGVYDWRIPGSMLAIPRENPEVVVTVNKMRSACERRGSDWVGNNCSFDFKSEATPKIKNIVLTGQEGEELLVTENDIINFEVELDLETYSVTLENSQVNFHPTDGHPMTEKVFCEFQRLEKIETNRLEAECRVGKLPEGEYQLQFTHELTGHSKSEEKLIAKHGITSTNKQSGSIHGGQEVTVIGFGFRPGYLLKVFNPPRDCMPISDRCFYNNCVCLTLSDDEMSLNDENISNRKRRANGDSPTITSLSETKISVLGGTLLTIYGTNFGLEKVSNKVTLFNPNGVSTDFNFVSWSDTAVVIETGGDFLPDSTTKRGTMTKGDYTLQIYDDENGRSNSVGLSVGLEIHSVYPQKSSVQGGLLLTIDGHGFATDTRVPEKALNAEFRVEVWADGVRCHVKEVTKDQIKCESGWGVNQHSARSTGEDFPDMNIRVGEAIRWEWSFTVDGKAPKMRFQKVLSPDDDEATDQSDFWSDTIEKKTGDFTKMFTTKGTYYYSTGFVDAAFSKVLHGKIIVDDAKERAAEFEVLVTEVYSKTGAKEFTADHIPLARKRRADECVISTNKSEEPLSDEDIPNGKVYIIYSWASTPFWKKLEYDEVKPSMTASIELEGFETTGDCAEYVIFSVGEVLDLSSEFVRTHHFIKSDENEAEFNGEYKLDHQDNLDTNKESYWFNVYVDGLGFAYYSNTNNDMKVKIESYISSISPSEVSTGGQLITITGEGLTKSDHNTKVSFMGFGENGFPYVCKLISAKYTNIECELQRIIGPTIYPNGRKLPLRIQYYDKTELGQLQGEQSPKNAALVINNDITPIVNAISISDTQIAFNGLNLDANNFEVSVKGETLINCSVSGDSIACDRPDISAGHYLPDGRTTNGWIEFHSKAIFGVKATAISSTSGSRYGGQELIVSGHGFDKDTLILLLKDGKSIRCAIHSMKPSEVVFYSPEVDSDGDALIAVSHDLVDSQYSTFDYTFNTLSNGDFSYIDDNDLIEVQFEESITLKNEGIDCSAGVTVEIALSTDPCGVNTNPCDRNYGICSVVNGKASCTCRSDYIGDGFECTKAGFQIKAD